MLLYVGLSSIIGVVVAVVACGCQQVCLGEGVGGGLESGLIRVGVASGGGDRNLRVSIGGQGQW